MAKKKSYNPFKMWGSYAGAVIISFLQYFTLSSTQVNTKIGQIIHFISPLYYIGQFWERIVLDNFFNIQTFNNNFVLVMIIIFILAIASGFLLGWGIHSLVRKLK